MVEAAAIPETFFTVWHNVFERGALKKGETLLVHGGASGIGTTAIQLASKFGAYVIATAGSDEKCAALLKLGADRAINYKTQEFVAAVKEATRGQGRRTSFSTWSAATIFPATTTPPPWTAASCRSPSCRAREVEADFSKLMMKRLTHTGSTLRARPVAFKAHLAAELEAKVWPLLQSRSVVPVIDMIYPLKDAWRAHERMEESLHIGKIVLDVG